MSLRCGPHQRNSDRVRERRASSHLPLVGGRQQAVCTYLDEYRLTPAWEPAAPEALDQFLLTERRYPLTSNSLALLFVRLSQRAGFTRTTICPSMLRDSHAFRYLRAGGSLRSLQEQLGLADLASVKRYRRFCDEQSSDQCRFQVGSEVPRFPHPSRRARSTRPKMRGRGRDHRR